MRRRLSALSRPFWKFIFPAVWIMPLIINLITLSQINLCNRTVASGRKIKLKVCAIFAFDEEGKTASEPVYFDGSLLLRQLGALS
jgi:hypothetical protein